MKIPAFFLVIIATTALNYGAEWYENLPPGVTRTEILHVAGAPASTRSDTKSFYEQNKKGEYPVRVDRYELMVGYLMRFIIYKTAL